MKLEGFESQLQLTADVILVILLLTILATTLVASFETSPPKFVLTCIAFRISEPVLTGLADF